MSYARGRRQFVLLAGGVMTATLAGCVGDDDDNDVGDDDADVEGFEIDPGTTIEFEGYTEHWLGLAPESIDGEENPTLILEDGGEYEMGWTNGDGALHNLEIRDDDREIVDDLQTESLDETDATDSLSFTASPEMTTYICRYHETTQRGDLVVQ